MNDDTTGRHVAWDALVGHWLGDTDDAATAAIDAHLMHCDACGARYDEIVALSRGTRAAFAAGRVATALSARFVEALKAAGLRVREYRVAPDGQVNCSIGPADDLLVSRLEAPLAGVARVDAVVWLSLDPAREQRLDDLPFDPAAGEVLLVPRVETVRALPDHDWLVSLRAVDAAGEREIGRYAFRHRAAG